MTREQFINFLKAPFSKSFIYAYVMALFGLLIVPVLVDFGQLLVATFGQVSLFTNEELEQVTMKYLDQNYNNPKLWQAVIGLFLAWLLTFAYRMRLIHKTVIGNQDVLEAESTPLGISEILLTIPKMLGLFVILMATVLGVILLVILGGMLVSSGLSLISGLLSGLGLVVMVVVLCILMYKVWCYIMAFNLIFYREWRLQTFFDYKRVRGTFLAHRMRVYALWLFSTILFSILSNIGSSLSVFIMQQAADVEIACSTMIPAGLVVAFIYVYSMLLQATIFGKLIVWAGKSE